MIYSKKIENLRKRKIAQTVQKLEYEGYLDEDDYGRIVPTFEWNIIPNHPDGNFYGLQGWTDNFCDLMEKHDVYVDFDDAFTGRWMYFMSKMRPSQYDKSLLPCELRACLEKYQSDAGIGFDAHFCPDYTIGLSLGWRGLIRKLEKYRKIHKNRDIDEFYDCHRRVIESIQGWIQRHIDHLDELIFNEPDKDVQAELCDKRDVNKRILHDPPKSYREALQWIIWFHLASRTFNRDGAGGQLDTLLYPYYKKDYESGNLTKDQAIYYMACFFLNDPVYWQIGGPDKDGVDQTNDLSFLILDAAEYANVSINLTLRVHDEMNKHLFEKGVALLVKYKQGWPRFSGDQALVKGFMKLGFDESLARERIATGCNWMSLPGKEYTVNDLFKVNMAKVFEIAWQDMMKLCGYPGLTNNIGVYKPIIIGQKRTLLSPSVSLLWDLFRKHLGIAVHSVADAIRFHLEIMKDNEVELLLNLLSHGPIERGLDVSDGGAMYYNLAIDGAGLGTVADSFSSLEKMITQEKLISWKVVNDLLRTNWASSYGENYRLMMKSAPSYGEGGSLGDLWAVRISDEFSKFVLKESQNEHIFIPGLFSWAKPHILGSVVGATPDGRHFGDPITHGANPNPGFLKNGAALAQSTAIAMVQSGYGNTAPLQLELDPFSLSSTPENIVKAIILSHFELGGTLININILDSSDLIAAHREPEKYPDLVVRVTGFTAFFSMLTPEFRQVLVDRLVKS